MNINAEKRKIRELVDTVNSMSPTNEIKFNQQDVKKKNISITGGNGRLGIVPVKSGYDIGLSGKSLEEEMSGFMAGLCGEGCTGYKQKNQRKNKLDMPYWRVEDFSLVQKAVCHYAGANPYFSPGEIDDPGKYIEGATKQISVNAYERNRAARKKCIESHGCFCAVCEFNFESTYGHLGKSYIHVHHVVPLSRIKQEYELDPINDLVPLCPNCHAMIHRDKERVLTIDELKLLIEGNGSD